MPFCLDRKSTRLNSSHTLISYAVFCLKKKKTQNNHRHHIMHNTIHTQHVYTDLHTLLSLPSYSLSLSLVLSASFFVLFFFFFNDTATTEIYTLSLHDALPI